MNNTTRSGKSNPTMMTRASPLPHPPGKHQAIPIPFSAAIVEQTRAFSPTPKDHENFESFSPQVITGLCSIETRTPFHLHEFAVICCPARSNFRDLDPLRQLCEWHVHAARRFATPQSFCRPSSIGVPMVSWHDICTQFPTNHRPSSASAICAQRILNTPPRFATSPISW